MINEHTATLLLIDDLVVLHTHFEGGEQSYTFVSREEWLPENLNAGDYLLAQVMDRHSGQQVLKAVIFDRRGDIADLDLDSLSIQYRFVLGRIGRGLIERDAEAQAVMEDTERKVRLYRAQAVRREVLKILMIEPETEKLESIL